MANIKQRIADICGVTGPRPAGSEAEQQAAEIITGQLEAVGAQVSTEQFSVRPQALHALLLASSVGYLAAYGAHWVSPTASLALVLLVLSQIAARMFLGASLWDLPLARKTSANVVGRIPPAGQRRRLLIFGGHHDSAFRMPLLQRSTFRLVLLMALLLMASTLLLLGLSIWAVVWAPGAGGLVRTVALGICGVGAACAVALPMGLIRQDSVMGANDNLSAVAVALAAGQQLASRGVPLQHTELWIVSFGSEETGLIGSRAFAGRHHEQLKQAMLVNLESLGQSGTLRVLTGELMAPTRHAPRVVQLVQTAAQSAGIAIRPQLLPGGLTDAASFSRQGLPAATVIRLDHKDYLDHYHNPGDDLPAIQEEGLQEALRLCVAIIDCVEQEAAEDSQAA